MVLVLVSGAVAFTALAMVQDGRVSLMGTYEKRLPSQQQLSRLDFPWAAPSEFNDPFGIYGENEFSDVYDPWNAHAYHPKSEGAMYGFEPNGDGLSGFHDEVGSLYSPQACIPQTYSDLPAGYICTSATRGVYALDPYGNMYGRRIQWKLRKILEDEEAASVKTAKQVPGMFAFHHHNHWVSPMDWLEPSLLPNASVCQELVGGFYAAISSPLSEDLANATALLDDKFVYSGSDVALVPGCVADVPPGYQVQGAEVWAKAFAKTVNAFGNSTSELYGNVSCTPQRNQNNKLLPTMKCLAHHQCTFMLKSIADSTGEPVTLEGPIVDTFVFDTEGRIVALKSEFDPKHFTVMGKNSTQLSDDEAKEVMAAS